MNYERKSNLYDFIWFEVILWKSTPEIQKHAAKVFPLHDDMMPMSAAC